MHADGIIDMLTGWCFLLSGIWGFLLFPFAIALAYQKKTKLIGVALLTAVTLFVVLLFHDIIAYERGKRPIIPFYEWAFSLFLPHDGLDTVLIDVPLSNCTTNISHYWRGNYGVTVWVPDKIWDLSDEDRRCLNNDIQLSGSFKRTNMQSVDFISNTNQSKKGEWSPKGGGSTIHYEYNVPANLPLDEVLTVEIKVSGDKLNLLSRFPDARIRIETLCVK